MLATEPIARVDMPLLPQGWFVVPACFVSQQVQTEKSCRGAEQPRAIDVLDNVYREELK